MAAINEKIPIIAIINPSEEYLRRIYAHRLSGEDGCPRSEGIYCQQAACTILEPLPKFGSMVCEATPKQFPDWYYSRSSETLDSLVRVWRSTPNDNERDYLTKCLIIPDDSSLEIVDLPLLQTQQEPKYIPKALNPLVPAPGLFPEDTRHDYIETDYKIPDDPFPETTFRPQVQDESENIPDDTPLPRKPKATPSRIIPKPFKAEGLKQPQSQSTDQLKHLDPLIEFKNKYQKPINIAKNISEYAISLPVGIIALASSVCAFIASNITHARTELLEKVSIYSNKISFFSGAISGVLSNFMSNNIFGMVGLGSDAITALGSPDFMYTVRGFGSALDAIPLTAENAAGLRENFVSKNFKDQNGKPLSVINFVNYPNFKENWKRTLALCKEIVKDTKKDIQGGLKSKKTLQTLWKLAFKGEFHLLVSTVGLLISASIASIGLITKSDPIKTFGARARDLFGFESDWGVWRGADELRKLNKQNETDRSLTGDQKKWQWLGDLSYKISGIGSYSGTIMDFIYRFIPLTNLHLAALGVDRFAQSFMVFGMFCHDKRKETTRLKKDS